jgi:hypothetical protein
MPVRCNCVALFLTAPLTAFDAAELFNFAMTHFNHPAQFGIFEPHQTAHIKVTAAPVFNVSICSDDLEYFDHTISFEMNRTARLRNINLIKQNISSPIWINMAIIVFQFLDRLESRLNANA